MNPKYNVFAPAKPLPGARTVDLTKDFTLEMKVINDHFYVTRNSDKAQALTLKGTRKHIIAAVILNV